MTSHERNTPQEIQDGGVAVAPTAQDDPLRSETMIDKHESWTLEGHLAAMRAAGAYRPMRLHAVALAGKDDTGVATMTLAGLRRALAAKDEMQCPVSEVETAVKHLVVAGVLEESSQPRRLVLTGTVAR